MKTAIDRVLQHEGGYVDHPADPGGATRWGVTQAVARRHGYTGHMRDYPIEDARRVYEVDYWDAAHCGSLPWPVAYQVFDAAINHGPVTAIKLLQRALGVNDDGRMGPVTLRESQAADPVALLLRFQATRLEYYTALGGWPSFGRGWTRRVAGNIRYAAEDTGHD